jgi:hypothetical protein
MSQRGHRDQISSRVKPPADPLSPTFIPAIQALVSEPLAPAATEVVLAGRFAHT